MTLGLLADADHAARASMARRRSWRGCTAIRERYVLDVDAPPRMRSRFARVSSR